jgi:hypothetical protein
MFVAALIVSATTSRRRSRQGSVMAKMPVQIDDCICDVDNTGHTRKIAACRHARVTFDPKVRKPQSGAKKRVASNLITVFNLTGDRECNSGHF